MNRASGALVLGSTSSGNAADAQPWPSSPTREPAVRDNRPPGGPHKSNPCRGRRVLLGLDHHYPNLAVVLAPRGSWSSDLWHVCTPPAVRGEGSNPTRRTTVDLVSAAHGPSRTDHDTHEQAKEVIVMVKFSRFRARPNVRSELKTIGAPVSRTHEGARAYRRDPKSELFPLAVTNMVASRRSAVSPTPRFG